tara:strand:+ start:4813 stop:5112 length:300 start_codon:yes stop_codon:yes gene_type:complete
MRRKRPNPISAKRREQMKLYKDRRVAYLAENKRCAVFPQRKATDVHHMRGRAGRLYLCEDYWLPVSREGHDKIHKSPEWARSKGFLCLKGEWGKQPEGH